MEQAHAQIQIQPKGFPLHNGTVKKTHREPPPPTHPAEDVLYRECLKNHAASLGGHALDGCGEFMPSPSATSTDPTSLKCAACGCHRNFHRRVVAAAASGDDDAEGEGEDDGRRRSSSPPPPSYFTSAPHTLLALSRDGRTLPAPVAPSPPVRKRFRSKFSPEQKGRMLELSEKLGWRMQKRDEGVVEECCKDIGVGMGVFKIWMHNNKYHLYGSRRVECGIPAKSNVADVSGGGNSLRRVEGNGSGVDSGEADGNGMNGSSSSS